MRSLFRTITTAVSCAACTVFLIGLPQVPAHADGEVLHLTMSNPPALQGEGFAATPLRVCRGSQDLGGVEGPSFGFSLPRAARTGEVYVVTSDCASPGTQTQVVASLAEPTVDVEEGWVYGAGGVHPQTLTVSVGNQYGLLVARDVIPNPDGTWAAFIGPAAFDLMRGVGVTQVQQLTGGSTVRRTSQVPNPIISVWDTHGSSPFGTPTGWPPPAGRPTRRCTCR